MKKPTLGAVANVTLILAAAAVAWNAMSRPQQAPAAPLVAGVPEKLWKQEFEAGISVGPAGAPLEIIELMDFQCPYCRGLSARLDSLEAELPGSARVSFHHWPLPNHPYAVPAAIAAECAYQQGAFTGIQKALFAKQDSIGVRSWTAYAEDAGVQSIPPSRRAPSSRRSRSRGSPTGSASPSGCTPPARRRSGSTAK
jgi:protein-disulfide isomerase